MSRSFHQKQQESQRGQALTEYVLLILMVAIAMVALFRQMPALLAKLEEPLQKQFKYTYKYGDPKARGFGEEEGPRRHPRYNKPDNFRLFGRGS